MGCTSRTPLIGESLRQAGKRYLPSASVVVVRTCTQTLGLSTKEKAVPLQRAMTMASGMGLFVPSSRTFPSVTSPERAQADRGVSRIAVKAYSFIRVNAFMRNSFREVLRHEGHCGCVGIESCPEQSAPHS